MTVPELERAVSESSIRDSPTTPSPTESQREVIDEAYLRDCKKCFYFHKKQKLKMFLSYNKFFQLDSHFYFNLQESFHLIVAVSLLKTIGNQTILESSKLVLFQRSAMKMK